MSDEIDAAVERLLNALDSASYPDGLRAELLAAEQRGAAAAAERTAQYRAQAIAAANRLAAVRECSGRCTDSQYEVGCPVHDDASVPPPEPEQGGGVLAKVREPSLDQIQYVRMLQAEQAAATATTRLRDAAQRARELLAVPAAADHREWTRDVRDLLRELAEEK